MSPRSILKRSSQRTPESQPHAVHFPPSPSLCSTFSAYSPSLYDRSPIVVSKNVCALPERGGRTYHIDETLSPQSSPRSPRSEATRSYRDRDTLPQLVPDISSSESDESDTFVQPPQAPSGIYSYGAYGLPTKYEYDPSVYSPTTEEPSVGTISFLPYPPSPPSHHDKSGRRRRQHDGAIDIDRIRRDNNSGSSTSEEERPIAASPPKKRSCSRRREYLSKLSAGGSAGYGMPDDGCLGGF